VSCVQESVPLGWRVWRQAAVPDPLAQFAIDVRDHVRSYPYGSIAKTIVYNGQTVGAFVSHHSWTYRNGVLVTGICIPGVSLVTQATQGVGATEADNLDTPDPTAAVYSLDEPPPGISWPIVAFTGAAMLLVVGGFWAAIQLAGRPRLP
jgi:hypothetical protein